MPLADQAIHRGRSGLRNSVHHVRRERQRLESLEASARFKRNTNYSSSAGAVGLLTRQSQKRACATSWVWRWRLAGWLEGSVGRSRSSYLGAPSEKIQASYCSDVFLKFCGKSSELLVEQHLQIPQWHIAGRCGWSVPLKRGGRFLHPSVQSGLLPFALARFLSLALVRCLFLALVKCLFLALVRFFLVALDRFIPFATRALQASDLRACSKRYDPLTECLRRSQPLLSLSHYCG
jgi:hypothetical protein